MRMITALEARPWYQLAVHFFRRLFDFGILSDAGSDTFRRILIAIVAVMLSVGLLITRMYLTKYAALSEMYHDWGSGYQLNREPYRLATLGDGASMLAFPMLIVAFVLVLVSTELFPDHLDYRVLQPLPVSKRVVFASKALAFALFTGIFAVSATLAMTPLVVLMWNSRWAEDGLLMRLVAHGIASVSASMITALVITGATGGLLIAVPRPRLRLVLSACRGLGLFGLVLLIPLASRLPAIGDRIVSESAWLYLVPPVWFVGVEQMALGHATPFFLRLTMIAVAVAGLSVAVAAGSYLYLYKRFERVLAPPATASRAFSRRLRFLRGRDAKAAALPRFITATLARSPLHQGVVVTIAACGAAIVLSRFLQHFEPTPGLRAVDSLRATVIWAPFALVFATNLALRAALAIPIEPRANWIFRLTEGETTRTEEIGAVARTLIACGVVPLTMLFPVTWGVLGWFAVPCTSVAAVGGVILVELQMMESRRIPFTCAYEPSTKGVARTVLVEIVGFVLFTTIGPRLVGYSSHPAAWLGGMAILAAAVLYLRRQRLWFSRQATLMFEDVLPNDVEPLRLSEY